MLADYLEGRLQDAGRNELEAHLAECELCLEELVAGGRLGCRRDCRELEGVPSRVTEAAVDLVIRRGRGSRIYSWSAAKRRLKTLLSGFKLPFPGGWQFSPIRGSRILVSKDLISLRKALEEMEAEIEIEKIGDSRADIRVRVLNREPADGVRVTLARGGREISSYLLGDDYVLFENTRFGHYSLIFTMNGEVLGRYHFEIKESPNG